MKKPQQPVKHSRLQRFYQWLILLLLVTPAAYAAQAQTPELTEEFIEFVIGQGKGVHFFPVMMNEAEEPYLDVSVILNDWLEIPTTCEPQRQYCQGTLYPEETIFWIDAQQKQFGHNKKGQPQPTVAADDIAFINNKIWLKYTAFPDWLPVNVAWTLYRYAMSMTANFLSLEQKKEKRQFDRKKYIATRNEKRRIAQMPGLKPNDENPFELRYDLNLGYKKDENVQTNASVQLLADIYRGTLQLNSSFKDKNVHSTIDSYQYQRYNNPWFEHIGAGNTHSFSSQLMPARRLTNGLRLETHENIKGAGKFEHWDVLRPNTEVDIFRNGILLETIITDQSGNFHLPEQLAAGGDRFTFKNYYTNGQVQSNSINIAPDDALLQASGSWDFNAATGRLADGTLLQTNIRHGISDTLSIGAHLHRANITQALDGDTVEQQLESGLSFDATWRLASQVNLQYEYLQLDATPQGAVARSTGQYHALSLNVTAFEHQQLLLNFFKIKAPSTATKTFMPRSNLIDNLVTINHGLNINQWNITTRFNTQPQQTLLVQNLSKRLMRKLSFSGGYTLTRTPQDGVVLDAIIGSNTNLFDSKNIQLSLQSEDRQFAIDGRYRLQGGGEVNSWDLNIKATHTFSQKTQFSLAATWRYKDNATLNFTTDGKSFGLRFSYNGATARYKPKLDFNHFAGGSVYGNIQAPIKQGQTPDPIVGLRIMAGNAVSITDSNGDFEIHGIPTNTDVLVKYDNNSLDVSYMMARPFDKVHLRPGTRVQLNPKVIGSVGFDGVVLSTTPLPTNTALVVKKKSDNSEVVTIAVEPDGFFLTEQLVAGEYLLEVVNIDNPPPVYHLSIGANQDWVGGIEMARPGAQKAVN